MKKTSNTRRTKKLICLTCDDTTGGLEYIKEYIRSKYGKEFSFTLLKNRKFEKPNLDQYRICNLIKNEWNKIENTHQHLFIIADGDDLSNNRVNNINNFITFEKNSNNKVKFILNTPCIEVWYLCHYKLPSSPPPDCIKQLQRHLPDYVKRDNPHHDISGRYTTATTHAQTLRKNNNKSSAHLWTDMDLL